MWDVSWGLFTYAFFFVYWCLVLAPFVEKCILPPLNFFCTFVKNQLGGHVELFLSSLFCPLICVSLLLPPPRSLACYVSAISFEIEQVDFSYLIVFQNRFSNASTFVFMLKFVGQSCLYLQNRGILLRIVINWVSGQNGQLVELLNPWI